MQELFFVFCFFLAKVIAKWAVLLLNKQEYTNAATAFSESEVPR